MVWIWCIVLALPSLIPLAMHFKFAGNANEFATGFIQNDQPYYMANAREHFDSGSFQWTYGNPNDWKSDSPRIYFQPQTLLLGAIRDVTGADPALIFGIFGFVFAVLTVRVAWLLLREFLPDFESSTPFILCLFLWGGGCFALAGLATMFLAPQANRELYDYVTLYDPFQGWWFLNLGRNLIFPTESYYHFLFLAGALMLARGKHTAAILIGLLISISHPFTGVEYLAIAAMWLFLERVFWQLKSTTWLAVVAAFTLLFLHVGYYQVWLNGFPAHRKLHEVWELAWEYKAVPMVLAYGLVAGFAIWNCRTANLATTFLSESKNRLLVVWFLVAFLLANHEFFMKSTQPLHFTRGYVWTPLFLAGAVTIQKLLSFLGSIKSSKLAMAVVLVVFCLDNATWLCMCSIDGRHNSGHTRTDFRAVMSALNEHPAGNNAVVVSNSRLLSYLSTVYTPHDSFVGHGYLTPDVEQNWDATRKFLKYSEPLAVLDGYTQLFVMDQNGAFVTEENFNIIVQRVRAAYEKNRFAIKVLHETDSFVVWSCTQSDAQVHDLANSITGIAKEPGDGH